ncbi:MAG: hypothetical protein ACD_75C01764G0001 [uncultured bacterium]|nr:MAG: hypothetical protein ACD_75C01764G0001 [uncultured bacterium]
MVDLVRRNGDNLANDIADVGHEVEMERIETGEELPAETGQAGDVVIGGVELVVERLHLEEHADASQNFRAVERFGDEVLRTGLDPHDTVFPGCICGDHNNRDIPVLFIRLDSAADLVTVHFRHHHIQQHDVHPFPLDFPQSLQAVRRRHDLEAA